MEHEEVKIATGTLLLADDLEVEFSKLDKVALDELRKEVQTVLDGLNFLD